MPEPAAVDSVVLRYFLFVGRQDLLVALLGRPLMVPRIVFDPDEGQVPEGAMSEITRSMWVERGRAGDPGRLRAARGLAAVKANRLGAIHEMHARGDVEIVELGTDELELFARLTRAVGARDLGLEFALDPGEAACVALAVRRGWVLATDDGDALKALEALDPGHAYERIRRLLCRAAGARLITAAQANELHAEMRRLGFWDTELPFPGDR